MANKNIDITITSKLIKSGFDAAKKAFKSLSEHAASVSKSVFTNLTNIKSGFEMLVSSATQAAKLLTKAFDFETMTVQFKTLFGNLKDAKDHMKSLQELGDTPPFSLEQFASASRTLLIMTNGVLGFKDSLNIVGDVATATGTDLDRMAQIIGEAFSFIRSGEDIGKATEQLVRLGAITPEVSKKLKNMQEAGASSNSIWKELTDQLSKFKGAMSETEKTANGLLGAIGSQKDNILREFGSALIDVSKGGLHLLLEKMKELRSSGAIQEWAEKAKGAIYTVIGAFSSLGDASKRGVAIEAIKDVVIGSFETAASKAVNLLIKAAPIIGGMIAKGFTNFKDVIADEFSSSAARYEAERQLGDSIYHEDKTYSPNTMGQLIPTIKKVKNADADRRIDELAQKIESEMRKNKADELRRQADDMTADYITNDSGKTRLDRGIEALRSLGEEASKFREKLTKLDEGQSVDSSIPKDSNAEQQRIVDALNHKRDIESDKKNVESNLKSAMSNAESEFQKTFAMYRNKELGRSTIEEEKNYQNDYRRLQDELQSSGQQWRAIQLASLISSGDKAGQIRKLEQWREEKGFTPEVESMIRAGASDYAKTSAEQELKNISKNTKSLAEKLDALLSIKG